MACSGAEFQMFLREAPQQLPGHSVSHVCTGPGLNPGVGVGSLCVLSALGLVFTPAFLVFLRVFGVFLANPSPVTVIPQMKL